MASTPLYKKLKTSGTTCYVFSSAAEDISAAYQNSNYKMYFSKYVLLNLPKQSSSGEPKYFDFDNFKKPSNYTPPSDFGDALIESLRNYVANQEVVIRESRLNNNEYYYDNNALETPTEKVFWKWCKYINLIDFEPAIPNDEYFSEREEFQSININDDTYFPEYLWKEREIVDWNIVNFYQTGEPEFSNPQKIEIEFSGATNFRVGDIISIYNVANQSIIDLIPSANTIEGYDVKVLKVINDINSNRVVIDLEGTISDAPEEFGQARLVYHKLVQYIGEITGVSNVQEANRSYTEVYAHVPSHTGQTPDILFRTSVDVNYKPNMTFPIQPSQYQPEIMGAESFTSPIVNSPQNYPGSYLGQFDTLDFTYITSNGDELRRSGDYYGVKGDINNVVIDSSMLDGLTVDFNTTHYVKMNIPNRISTNFDEFNALTINNEPPKDFEFNAILWYYTVEDGFGNTRNNLYGITFFDNPNNNVVPQEVGLRFPTIKKLVANGNQDGTAYSFNLSLNFNIINENPIEAYNPQAINSLFSMNLFNQAMSLLSSTNDSFFNIIAEHNFIREEIESLRGLIYTQTDINTINTRIRNLEDLLRLFSTNQIVSSGTIQVNQVAGTPPLISMDTIHTHHMRIETYNTSQMFTQQGVLPINITLSPNRTMMINIVNDDITYAEFVNNDRLILVLGTELTLRQTIEINILGKVESTQNKKLDIYMVVNIDGVDNEVLLIGNIDLPIFTNEDIVLPNSAYLWSDFKFDIDFDRDIMYKVGGKLEIPISGNTKIISNSIKIGDTLVLNNLFFGTASFVFDYSGQYKVVDVMDNGYITLDVSNNTNLVTAYTEDLIIHSQAQTLLGNLPYFSLNKGKNIKITRTDSSNIISERYLIDIVDKTNIWI